MLNECGFEVTTIQESFGKAEADPAFFLIIARKAIIST
jgi:hypothetical protein